MSKITPPHVANGDIGCSCNSCNSAGGAHHCACRLFLCLLVLLCAGAVVLSGYRAGVKASEPRPEDGNPVPVSKALFFNNDSVMYYYEQGLRFNNPKGLYVIGVTAHLRQEGTLPDYIYAPSVEEGDKYLLESANLGYRDAIQTIYCLHNYGCWNLELPTPQK